MAGAVLFKLFALETALPLAWAVAGVWPLGRRAVVRLSIVAASAFIPLVLDFGLVSPRQQWRQVVELHDRVASVPLPNLILPGRILWDFLMLDAGLSLLAAAGLLVLLMARRVYAAGVIVLWLPGSLLMLLVFRPLFSHHAAILAAPLAVSAGLGVGEALARLAQRRLLVVPVAVAAVAYLVFLPRLAHDDRHLLISEPDSSQPLVAWLASHSRTTQFIATDDVRSADMASRLVPPPLCDPSTVRVKAGSLTAPDLIAATRLYRPAIVLPTGVFKGFPEYIRWLSRRYSRVRAPQGATAYLLNPPGGGQSPLALRRPRRPSHEPRF